MFRNAPPEIAYYQDDIYAFSQRFMKLYAAQKEAYKRIITYNLVFEPTKAATNYPKLQVLGHIVTAGGFRTPALSRISAIFKLSKQLILANLEPMVNDPTTDIQKSKTDVRGIIKLIRNKLDGIEEGFVFRSDIGHVSHLMEQATSPENLSQMYIGWAPFL